MGVLKKLTKTPKFLRPLLGDTWLDEAGTVGGFAVGGPGGAAAGRAAGKLAATGDIKKAAIGAVEGYGMGAGAGALGLKGGSMALPKLGLSQVTAAAPAGAAPAANVATTAGSRALNLGGAGDVAKSVIGWGKKNPELVLAGLSAFQGARQSKRAGDLQNEALGIAREEQLRRGMLADEVLQKLRGVDLTGGASRSRAPTFYDPGNPYARAS